ncbi:MAG: NADPH:quinone reductase [Chloroflexota bacterium]|nr:MAG: NADPH:quinone reductase [Chloroflexota bacterium]
MKAIVYQKYGPPDVLELQEVEKPNPKDNEVLIKVQAASVNSWDWDLVTGKPLIYRLVFGLQKPKHPIIGSDIAGRIEAVGRNVKQFQPGEEIFGDVSGCGFGAFAEYVCAREEVLALKPAGMTFAEAAAVPQAGVLALQGLRQGQIKKVQKVLINGAGGGVGTFAVQMAKSWGAEVTGVDNREKLDLLRSLGADKVIDYTQEDFTKTGQRYDLILDVVAHRSIFDYKRALSSEGILVIVGGSIAAIFQAVTLGTWFSKTGPKKMGILAHKPNASDLELIKELIETGKVVPVIDRCYPLSEVAEALRYLGEGHARGKVVIMNGGE